MSRVLIEAPVSDAVRAAVSTGWAAYERATRDLGPCDEHDRRLIVAQNAGLIRYVGVTPSTLKSTKSARVNVYAPIPGALT